MRPRDGARSPWWQRLDWFTIVGALLSIGFVMLVLASIQAASS